MSAARIAFHATLKAPDHPTPSGDRTMARLLVGALETAGFDVRMPSRISTRTRVSDAGELGRIQGMALAEADRLVAGFRQPGAWRPDLWFTYHLYYKAPDWIGAAVARTLDIPYVVAEASYAGKRDRDGWAPWQQAALAQLRAADRIFCVSEADRRGIAPFVTADRLVDLPPFLDTEPFSALARPAAAAGNPIRLVTIAMMREGVKLDSYRHLAAALDRLSGYRWTLTIVGDGPARAEVEPAFATLPAGRVTWHGLTDATGVRSVLANSDLMVWPGIGEAFGMVYLEAAAAGVPSIAYANGGIASVIRDGETGLLVAPGDVAAYAEAIASLIESPVRRATLAANACAFAHGERSLGKAAARLAAVLHPLADNGVS